MPKRVSPQPAARLTQRSEHFGIAAVQSAASEDDATTLRRLAAQPNVDYLLHDRIVSAHTPPRPNHPRNDRHPNLHHLYRPPPHPRPHQHTNPGHPTAPAL